MLAPAPPPHPTDYFVPHFGMDKEIKGTQNSIAEVEKQMGHFWNPELTPPPPHPTDYFVPNFGMDNDISVSLKNLND